MMSLMHIHICMSIDNIIYTSRNIIRGTNSFYMAAWLFSSSSEFLNSNDVLSCTPTNDNNDYSKKNERRSNIFTNKYSTKSLSLALFCVGSLADSRMQ